MLPRCASMCTKGNILLVVLQAFGRIRHNKLVYFDGDGAALRGQLVMVRVDECNAYSLFGEVVEVVGHKAAQPGQGLQQQQQQQQGVLAAV